MTGKGDGGRRRVVYGAGPVRELVEARPHEVRTLHVLAGRASGPGAAADPVARLTEAARAQGVVVEVCERAELDRLAGPGARHQGVVAITGEYVYAELADLLAAAERRGQPPLLVALDGVQDPHNLGAVIRSTYVLGGHGVIVPRERAAQVTGAVAKAAAGATEHIGVAQVVNLVRALEELKERGVWLAAIASGPGARPLWELDGRDSLCLVIGAEGTGIRPLVLKTCDHRIEIPMAGAGVGSLNASVAAGVALYEVSRRRSEVR